jgi:hypothetical protein
VRQAPAADRLSAVNTLLARGLVRQHEIDIRMAIGASRARALRQPMTEDKGSPAMIAAELAALVR